MKSVSVTAITADAQLLGSFLLSLTVSENFWARSGGEQQGPGSPLSPKGAAKVEIWQKEVLMTSSSGHAQGMR